MCSFFEDAASLA